MISFDTNVLIYATAAGADERARRARDLLARAMMQAANSVLLLQSLAAFSNVAIRKAGIPVQAVQRIVQSWCAVLPIQAADANDLTTALEAVRAHRLAFWDAMLWASAQRAGVRHMLTEDFQDGFVLQYVTFINPFRSENVQLIDKLLPRS
jgi:predicted nucleic acid-binding protein